MSPLHEIAAILRNGKSIRQSSEAGGLPITRIETISDGTINPAKVGYAGLFEEDAAGWLLQDGDILISHINSTKHLGKCAIYEGVPQKLVHGMNLLSLRVDRESAEPKYVYHILSSPSFRRQLPRITKNSVNQSSFNISSFKRLRLPLPPLPEQKRIAKILDAADALRAKRRESLAQLDALLQSTFLDMFGDPVENPKGWEIATLGEVARNEDGRRVPLKKADRDQIDGIYPYYGASGIIDYVDDYIFDGPRLLIGEDGANLVARSTPVAFIAEGKYWVNNHAHVLAYSGSASLIFLRDLVNLIDLKPYITGTAQPKLNQKQLNRIKVPIPPMDLQERYCLIVSAVEKQRINSIKQIDELQALFSCLQGRAFMGQL
ncbi:restriction endonuclease subunit S [Wenzhouxiangella limi]|uniref:Type I restriction modification DNA specificity domain-containing protein n=1 Tax=Wenzhouxiangella limi TaxID=2707351 RepID=A0A845VG62_9GAMM|nr:hypothetical protein [Wenzhouxiangella limi]